MADLAHRIAPHDELVRLARLTGATGKCLPDFGYLTGFTRAQCEAITTAYDEGRRAWLAHRAGSRS
jgi:hypothetical protein